LLDVRQAEQLVYAASAAIPNLEKQIQQQENLISILVGENPGNVTRGLEANRADPRTGSSFGPPFSPARAKTGHSRSRSSTDVDERSDWGRKSRLFPAINLTSLGGVESVALSNLFTGPAGTWSFAGQLNPNRSTREAA